MAIGQRDTGLEITHQIPFIHTVTIAKGVAVEKNIAANEAAFKTGKQIPTEFIAIHKKIGAR